MLKVPLLLGTAAFLAGQNQKNVDLERGDGVREEYGRGRSSASSSSRTVGRRRDVEEIEEGEKGVSDISANSGGAEDVAVGKAGAGDDDDDVDDEQDDSGTASPTQGDGAEPELSLNLFGTRTPEVCPGSGTSSSRRVPMAIVTGSSTSQTTAGCPSSAG